jgi:hypothetical protein
MLCRIGLLAAIVLGCASATAAETKNIDRTLPLSATGTVEIDAHNGRIDVRTWDRPEVEVHVRIDWPGLSSSSYRFRDTTVNVEGSQDRVIIKWISPDQYGWSLWSLFDGGWIGPGSIPSRRRGTRGSTSTITTPTPTSRRECAVHLSTHNGMVRMTNLPVRSTCACTTAGRAWIARRSRRTAASSRTTASSRSRCRGEQVQFESRGHHVQVDSDFQPATHASYYRPHGSNVSGTVNGGGPHRVRLT